MRIDIADRAVVAGEVEHGIANCGSGVSVSVCANKVPGVRAALIHDFNGVRFFSAFQRADAFIDSC